MQATGTGALNRCPIENPGVHSCSGTSLEDARLGGGDDHVPFVEPIVAQSSSDPSAWIQILRPASCTRHAGTTAFADSADWPRCSGGRPDRRVVDPLQMMHAVERRHVIARRHLAPADCEIAIERQQAEMRHKAYEMRERVQAELNHSKLEEDID